MSSPTPAARLCPVEAQVRAGIASLSRLLPRAGRARGQSCLARTAAAALFLAGPAGLPAVIGSEPSPRAGRDLQLIPPLDLRSMQAPAMVAPMTSAPASPTPTAVPPEPVVPPAARPRALPSPGPAPVPVAREQVRLTLPECRAAALGGNLELKVQLLAPLMAAEAITEAEARFEAAFVGEASYAVADAPGAGPGLDAQTEDARVRAGIEQPLTTGGTVSAQLVDARTQRRDSAAPFSTSYSPDFSISISQPLLRSAGRRANTHAIRIAGYQHRMAEARTRLEVIRVLTAVDRAYWRLYAARRQLDVRHLEQDLAKAQLENARRLVNSGERPQIEIVRAETAVAEREEAILIAENDVRERERSLQQIMRGQGFTPGQRSAEMIPATEPDPVHYVLAVEKLVPTAIENRMELLETELQIAADNSTVEFLTNDTLPLVALEYTYNVSGLGQTRSDAYDLLNDKDYEDHRLGLMVRVPLGNQAARSRLRQALRRRQQDLISRENRQVAIEVEVLNAADRQQVAWQRILASRQRAILSGRLLEAEQRQFEIGVGTSTDLLGAQTRLADAQSAEIQALTEYEIALVDLSYATGLVLGADKVRWSTPELPPERK